MRSRIVVALLILAALVQPGCIWLGPRGWHRHCCKPVEPAAGPDALAMPARPAP
jgi:hypothetical protein